MTELPETRESLLLRIGDPADAEAWTEFATLYQPAVYRLARRRGLQDADAEDLTQRVLLAISAKIADWRPASPKGSFRAWLKVIARNLVVNAVTRRRPDLGKGGTSLLERLQNQPARTEIASELEEEYRRALFRRAAEQIRPEFEPATWDAFWLTAVEGIPIDEAARRLGRNVGIIYAGRSRVMRRFKEQIRALEFAEREA